MNSNWMTELREGQKKYCMYIDARTQPKCIRVMCAHCNGNKWSTSPNNNERTNETSNSNEWREEKRTKKEKHTITLAEGKKTTHIAFINIIKSLCAAAILNSTVFFFISRFTSFSLPLCQFSYAIPFGTLARCVVVILFFYCITKATLPLLMFRIPMFFFLFFNLFLFSFYILLLCQLHATYVYKVTCFCSIRHTAHRPNCTMYGTRELSAHTTIDM